MLDRLGSAIACVLQWARGGHQRHGRRRVEEEIRQPGCPTDTTGCFGVGHARREASGDDRHRGRGLWGLAVW
jgi:hypothetical protein